MYKAISSTALDLPRDREKAIKACLREGVLPIAMEHLPARDADAIRVSLEMVDEADIYIGIYRGGTATFQMDMRFPLPKWSSTGPSSETSPFELLLSQNHPLLSKWSRRTRARRENLRSLRNARARAGAVWNSSPPSNCAATSFNPSPPCRKNRRRRSEEKPAPSFHPPNTIPAAPEPYIAHPYSLLQTRQVIGRQTELNLLTDWVTTSKQVPADVRLFNLVAIGGMGKSALTWKWFNDAAPRELPNHAGWMWWSFYESDAHYENFIIRALAYASGQTEKAVREMKPPDREDQLWHTLDEQPFVLVLDGLERILLAYSRMDAAHMPDDDLDERTANRVANAFGLPESAGQSFIGKHQLRLTTDGVRAIPAPPDTHAGLAPPHHHPAYPAELQADTSDPLPGVTPHS